MTTRPPLTARVCALIAAFTLGLAALPAQTAFAATSPYTDVPSTEPYLTQLAWLNTAGIVTGTTLAPESAITRAEAAAWMYQYGGPATFTPPTKSPFSDVSTSHARYRQITWMRSAGLVSGSTFGPSSNLTNADAADWLHRLAGRPSVTAPATSPFPDVAATDARYPAVVWLTLGTRLSGTAAGSKFYPGSSVLRRWLGIFLYRFDQLALPDAPTPSHRLEAAWEGDTLTGWTPAGGTVGLVASDARRAEYNPPQGRNVEVVTIPSGGTAIRITTRRHCTATRTDPLIATGVTGANESTSPCPAGMFTRYSTGRLHAQATQAPAYMMTARVKLPDNPTQGTRWAVWTNSTNLDSNPLRDGYDPRYCDATRPETQLAEFDLMEWYGINPTKPTATAHIGCSFTGGAATYNSHGFAEVWPAGYAGRWREFAVDVTSSRLAFSWGRAYSKPVLTVTPSGTWNQSTTTPSASQVWPAAIGAKQQLIIQGEVFGGSRGGSMSPVQDSSPFPAQSMLVDYVHVFRS